MDHNLHEGMNFVPQGMVMYMQGCVVEEAVQTLVSSLCSI